MSRYAAPDALMGVFGLTRMTVADMLAARAKLLEQIAQLDEALASQGAVSRFVVPIRTVSEANTRGHWAKRAKRASGQRGAVAVVLCTKARRPALPCAVTLTRIAPRELDDDNLRGALKACRDGVADWLGVDDRDPRVEWRYGQRRGPAKQYAVEVSVEVLPCP